jgi:hypothetical protein
MSVATGDVSSSFVIRLIVGAVVLGIGVFLVSQVFAGIFAPQGPGSVEIVNAEATYNTEGERTDIVRDTSGRAAVFGGSGSLVVNDGLGFLNATEKDGTASFVTHARIDDPSRSQVIYQLGDNYQLSYAADSGDYQLWYFDASTRDSYALSVNASDPTGLQPILIERQNDKLRLESTAEANEITTTGDSFVPLPTDNSLDGALEETRVINRTLTDNDFKRYISDPIQPVAVGNRTARLMLDTGGSGVDVSFRSSAASLNGDASKAEVGVDGDRLDRGTDYALAGPGSSSSQTLIVLSGGQLEDMPRAFVNVTNDFEQLIELVNIAFGLAGVVLLVVIAVRVLTTVRGIGE